MEDEEKTKRMLIEELASLRHKISELERSESQCNRVKKALQEENELFSLYMRHSPIYTYIKEVTPAQSLVLYASDNFREMIGILGSEVVGKTMTELFPPEFAAKITADDWAVVYKGGVLKLDEELNGRSYTTVKFPITLGEKTLLAGYTIDITERKRTEEALRNTQTRYRMLFEHSPDGIVIIDPDTMRPLEFNETAHQQLGYSREEFARLSIIDLDVSETPDETREHIQKVIYEGRSDFDTLHRTRQGEIRNIHVTAQNIEILGRPVYHCIWRDVTNYKLLDDELILKTRNIEEVNTALKVLLKQVEEGKTDLEDKILSNIRELVLPHVNRLKNTPLSDIQKTILRTTESNLNNITSTFLNSLKIKFYNLTPREIEVAAFVREGRSAKEIALLLSLSQKTVELHRGSLRKKLGLCNKKINLRSYLNTIQ